MFSYLFLLLILLPLWIKPSIYWYWSNSVVALNALSTHVVFMESYYLNGMGYLILELASHLDALSVYPFELGYTAMLLVEQLLHHLFVHLVSHCQGRDLIKNILLTLGA